MPLTKAVQGLSESPERHHASEHVCPVLMLQSQHLLRWRENIQISLEDSWRSYSTPSLKIEKCLGTAPCSLWSIEFCYLEDTYIYMYKSSFNVIIIMVLSI